MALLVVAGGIGKAYSQTFNVGNVTVALQSTVGYTFGERTGPVNDDIATLNTDDGDRNFRSGIMEDRLQTLEQLRISYGDYGFRASAQAWVDTVYLGGNLNNSADTLNSVGVGNKSFTSDTTFNDGLRFEPLAAFFYGAENFAGGNQRLTWQVGRQTITWGESLFSLDGISGLQAPVDIYSASSLPNPQAQALFLPTGAASVSYALGGGISLSAYWQFEFEPDILPGVGSYFSTADIVGPGAQRILASTVSNGALSIYRDPDIGPSNGFDQFGFSGHMPVGNYELGAYFVRGIPKTPQLYLNSPAFFTPEPSGLKVGAYRIVYPEPVNAFAVSASTLIAGANVAAELSGRTNQPLVSTTSPYTGGSVLDYRHPFYAIGDVMDLQISSLYVSPPLPLMPNGATFAAELTLNDVLSVTRNRRNLQIGNTSEGGSFEATFTPNWFPRSNIEIETPIGWATTFLGDSQYDASAAGTGTIDAGIKAIYNSNLTVGANYQRYYGSPTRQAFLDRDFVTIYVQRTF